MGKYINVWVQVCHLNKQRGSQWLSCVVTFEPLKALHLSVIVSVCVCVCVFVLAHRKAMNLATGTRG